MTQWEEVFTKGFAPIMSDKELECLRDALINDSIELLQGQTTSPDLLDCIQYWPCKGACAIAYAGWKGQNLNLLKEVEEYFSKLCFECDKFFDEPAICRHFLNWFDDTARSEVKSQLVPTINRILNDRFKQNRDFHA